MNLEQWRKKAGYSQAAFGMSLLPPVTQGLVSQWELGSVRMTLDYALQTEKLSTGYVTPQDCADMFKPEFSQNAA